MSALIPAGVELNGVGYRIVDRLDLEEHLPYSWRPYKESIEQKVIQAAELSGSSRPAKTTRPDVLTWRLDDFSGGEGQKLLDSSDDLNFRKYYNSNGAVDVRTRGQVSLGLAFAQSKSQASVKQGPFLVHRNAAMEMWYDDTVSQQPLSTLDTWTNKGTMAAAAGNLIAGPARVHGGYVFAAYKDGTGGASSSKVRRIDTAFSASTFISASNRENALPADNRLYVVTDNSGKLELRRTALTGTLPLAETLVYTVDNVGNEYGMDNVANRVFIVSQYNSGEEEPRVHYFNGSTGIERARLPVGFRMNFPAAASTDVNAYDAAINLGDIFFVFGYRVGATGFPEAPMLVYVSGGRVGTVGLIREGDVTARGLALHGGFRNQLLMGTNVGNVFVYDVQNGGISQLFDGITSGEDIVSLDYYGGMYWAATRTVVAGTSNTVKVYRTQATGANKYPTSATLRSSYWDFNFPEANKLIQSLEIVTAPLPTGTSISISLLLDDNTTITTDKVGATLIHNTAGATRKKFFISGIDQNGNSIARQARVLRVDITLTSDSTHANSPTVYSVNINALPREFEFFYESILSLKDDAPGEMSLPYATTGEKKLANLRAIKDLNPAQPVKFRPRYTSGNLVNIPETNATTMECILEECDIILEKKGQGYARVLLRRIDT